jgi:hypothetical protein
MFSCSRSLVSHLIVGVCVHTYMGICVSTYLSICLSVCLILSYPILGYAMLYHVYIYISYIQDWKKLGLSSSTAGHWELQGARLQQRLLVIFGIWNDLLGEFIVTHSSEPVPWLSSSKFGTWFQLFTLRWRVVLNFRLLSFEDDVVFNATCDQVHDLKLRTWSMGEDWRVQNSIFLFCFHLFFSSTKLIFSPRKDWDSEISPQNWKAVLLIMTYILART